MQPKALFFGAIGVLCETSELQRAAFNQAFREAGLNWSWSVEAYRDMLRRPGGARRVADFAAERGETVDATALHARKSEIFQEMLRRLPMRLRPGVADTLVAARALDLPLGFVTTTDIANVEAVLDADELGPGRSAFRFVGHRDMVRDPKPAPEIYEQALAALGLSGDEALAIEDSPESAAAALAAGIPCIAFPGAAHAGRDFGAVRETLDTLSPSRLGLLDPGDMRMIA
jgi:beta-phosphoglucomutase-like phosphatase (HAD superfamily)